MQSVSFDWTIRPRLNAEQVCNMLFKVGYELTDNMKASGSSLSVGQKVGDNWVILSVRRKKDDARETLLVSCDSYKPECLYCEFGTEDEHLTARANDVLLVMHDVLKDVYDLHPRIHAEWGGHRIWNDE